MSNFPLRKTYRNEIYSYRPSWVLRWGITFSFLFLTIIVVVSGFIKYPEIITANAEITTINPPVHMLARVDGKLENILVQEGEHVSKGDILAVMHTPVNMKDVWLLAGYLETIDSLLSLDTSNYPAPSIFSDKLVLGELQSPYSEVLINYNKLYHYHFLNFKELDLKSKKEEYENEMKYQGLLLEKNQILNHQLDLAYHDFLRDSLLYADGVIPEREFAKSRQQNDLQYRSLISDLQMGMVVSQANSAKLQREMENILFQDKDYQIQLNIQLKQNIRLLRAAIHMWELNYLFISPINGKVSFTELWNKNQNLSTGSVVVSVVPEDDMIVKTRIKFPVLNSGKVKVGQRVNIKLENFPHQEFGMLVGKMGNISTVPNGAYYSADVILPKGLMTSYGDRLPMVPQGTGKAEILTEEISLLMRFFNPIKAVFDEYL